jgi:molecular chaperone DnaJ
VQQELRFEEAIFGAEKEVRVSRLEHCSVCGGSGAEPGTQRERCPQCEGSGEIRRAQRSVFGQFVNVMVCERCEGEGAIITDPCRNCGGVGREQRNRRLKVKIPGGVDDGSQMRLTGEGDAGMAGGPNGNLYVQLRVKPHAFFERDGDDLVTALPINVAQAALGLHVEVPTLEDETESLHIPEGTQHNDEFRLRRRGVPHLRGRGRGDLVVRVAVQVPRKLNREQAELFAQLGEALGNSAGEHGRDGIFSRLKDAFTA